MNTTVIIILTIILLFSILITLYILQLKKIEYYKIRVDEAQKLIVDELNNRYELIMNTETGIIKNTKKELDIYSDLKKVKKSIISSYDLDLEIIKAIKTIYTIETDYPKINENKDMKNILRDLKKSDTKIIAAKSFYNTNATKLNDIIKKLPYNIIAKINHIGFAVLYKAEDIFDEDEIIIKN